jgi:hypothetical protein
MSLPIWDPIELPPDYTLVDINSLDPEPLLQEMQARALQEYMNELELGPEDFMEIVRDWNDEEGIFAVFNTDDEIVGVTLIVDVEDA